MGPGDSLSLQQLLLEYDYTSCGLDPELGTEDPGVKESWLLSWGSNKQSWAPDARREELVTILATY